MRTLYQASTVRTLSHPAVGEWVLVDERHVQRVGSGTPPEADRTVELPGATIIPGFIDAHVHLTSTGFRAAGPEMAAIDSGEALLALARSTEPAASGSVLIHGYDESKWPDPRLPAMVDLDSIPHPLVIVRTDSHAALANSAALQMAGALDMDGVERDASGSPVGLVRLQASARLLQWFTDGLSENEIEEFQLRGASVAASRGVTSLHEMSIPAASGLRDLEVLLGHASRLPVDVVPYVATTDIGYVLDLGLSRIGGDLSLDGSIGARSACVSGGYVDQPTEGTAYFSDDGLSEFLHDAHLAGLQVGMHAIGDLAIEQAVSAWERVYQILDTRLRRHFRARRHRIEHFEMPRPDQIERAAILGLVASIQPAFDSEWGHPGQLYEQRLGEDRASAMNPFRTLMERGLEIGAGSDSPITSLDPMAGILALETHHASSQRYSREEAIRIFTRGGAKLAHQEDKKGHLDPGTHADFAAFDIDPMSGSLERLRPILTVSLGREVYAH